MITLKQCAYLAGLSPRQILFGVVPSRRHEILLASYEANIHHGPQSVRDLIIADLHMWLDFSRTEAAADALLILRLFLEKYPEALYSPRQSPRYATHHRFGRAVRAKARRGGLTLVRSSGCVS
jgi:hypothetical protein